MDKDIRADTPWSEFELTVRDQFAFMERTTPVLESIEVLAKYLDVHPDLIRRKGVRHYSPMALAKWRYACADAMLNARRKRIGKPVEAGPNPDGDAP